MTENVQHITMQYSLSQTSLPQNWIQCTFVEGFVKFLNSQHW